MGNLLGVAGRAIIRRANGQILLIRRSEDSTTDPGLWELPGGKLDFGEPLDDALSREVAEETGLDVEVGDAIHVGHRLVEPFWVTVVTFECGVTDQEVFLSEEHSAYTWATMQDIDGLELGEGTREQVEAWTTHRERIEGR